MIIVSLLGSTADAQRNVTAISGQKILILSDGRWIYSPVENQNDANKTAEMPIMVSKTIENIQLIQRAAEKKEVEKFLVFELFKKDLDSKKVQILNAKKLRNKDEEKKLSNDAVDLKTKIVFAERIYKNSAITVAKTRKLRILHKKELYSQLGKLEVELNIKIDLTDFKNYVNGGRNFSSPVFEKKPETGTLVKNCKGLTNKTKEESRYDEMQSELLFNFTHQQLRSHFKEKELMEANVSIIVENKKRILILTYKQVSKDAENNYGFIPNDGLLRIDLISGKKIDLYAMNPSISESEPYTGNVVYQTEYLMKDEDKNELSEVPLDSIGMKWSSDFETYKMYNVDIVMNQIACSE